MIPVQDLLHRIRWDPAFGQGDYEIGYVDRVAGGVVRVPFRDVRVGAGDAGMLEVLGADGLTHHVPLHRVREVWRDGTRIWQRAPEGAR